MRITDNTTTRDGPNALLSHSTEAECLAGVTERVPNFGRKLSTVRGKKIQKYRFYV